MLITQYTTAPDNGWTEEEIDKRMAELLHEMMDASKYGTKAMITEETSTLEIDNLYKTLNEAYVLLGTIKKGLLTSDTTRMRRKLRLDFDI